MATANDSVFTDKRDLHIGGTGPQSASGADRGGAFPPGGFVERAADDEEAAWSSGLAAAAEALVDGVERWANKARDAARNTDGFVRTSPWQALGVVALAGIAVGYLAASRRNVPERS